MHNVFKGIVVGFIGFTIWFLFSVSFYPRSTWNIPIGGSRGAPYDPKAIRRTILERFGDEISTKTLQNWKSDIEGQIEKYHLSKEYIQEVIDRALRDFKREREKSGKPSGKDTGTETGTGLPGEVESGNGNKLSEEIEPLPTFASLTLHVAHHLR